MKKLILPLVAVLFCMASCQKENGILYLITETYTGDAKLHLDGENFAVWDNNDKVLVNGAEYAVAVGSGTATITGVPAADSYTAIFPADWANTTGTTITYPATQTYSATSIDAPMAAYSDGNNNLEFRNLGSVLAVEVANSTSQTMSVQKIEVVAEGSTLINGTASISFSGDRPALGNLSNGTTTTTLKCNGVSITAGNTETFYIAMPPVEAQLTIKVYDQYFTYTKTQASAHTMAASHGYAAPVATSDSPVQYAPMNNQILYTAASQIDLSLNLTYQNPASAHSFIDGKGIITFSDNIDCIPSFAFDGNLEITSILLPSCVTYIGTEAFSGCQSLESINLSHVNTLDVGAFTNCSELTSVDIPLVETIPDAAFDGCSGLTSVNIPTATEIGTNSFRNCSRLASIDLPAVTSIGATAFRNCSSLSRIDLYQNLSTLGNSIWASCTVTTLNWHISSTPTVPTSKLGNAFINATLHVLKGSDVSAWDTWRGTRFTGGVIADLEL